MPTIGCRHWPPAKPFYRSQDRADGRDAETALSARSKSRPMAKNQKGRPRAPETQLQTADHSGATSMKSGASSVTQCDLQVTSIIGILNAHCGLGSSRGRARLRVVIRQQPPRASPATRRAGALDRAGAPLHHRRSARGLKRARPRLIARGACCNTRRRRRKARRCRRSLSCPLFARRLGPARRHAPPSTDGVAARLAPSLSGARRRRATQAASVP